MVKFKLHLRQSDTTSTVCKLEQHANTKLANTVMLGWSIYECILLRLYIHVCLYVFLQ